MSFLLPGRASWLAVLPALMIGIAHADSTKPYQPLTSVTGTIKSVGSDTLVYIMSYWLVEFKRHHKWVVTRIEAAGSSTAPPALLAGKSSFGPMSRKMKDKEIRAFTDKHGYAPTAVRVALDGLAVYVHDSNPITGLNLPQVDAIFSENHRCGHTQNIDNWGQLGLKTDWGDLPISLFGRNRLSGTRSFFKKKALCKGKFKTRLGERSTSELVVKSVSVSRGGIGYSGIGYSGHGARAIAIAKTGSDYIKPTPANVLSGRYPLSRYLYLYLNKPPGQPLTLLQQEFIRMVFSADGQDTVESQGFYRLSNDIITEELRKLGM
ncbi:MAG: phosphate ABC transporter substrate-binding protein [Proteobacteria bacterium]|nr:phosphate ABC transporter substrate-binding protein [Pseudomonadota bacterium]